ncbi:hypothetical protein HH213_09485 [Duganella dendranthematis]|jgi:DNA-directed RNA polymerase delta subunit|uniref:Uncharacterized protein n=1 Tax=Duganella dendranthematis TaxID=2728021 RepID=A0ABX6M8A0_9BURK|nr:hypothetical protein [Duganella dendranthematis]QJD90289.1 hypothetical protein HH213_09485 [Duganella dendranthematis]
MAEKKKKDSAVTPSVSSYSTAKLPFETDELRTYLERFFNRLVENLLDGRQIKIGNFKWGIYWFYDYDNEPTAVIALSAV